MCIYNFVSLLGTCGEQVMCWRYSCQNGYAILAQAVPLWSKHSKNVPILLFAYGVFKSSGKWDGHCGFLLSDWNGNGHREWLHVTQHNGNRGCAGRGCDRFRVWSQPHKGDPCCAAPRNGEGDGAPGVGPEAGDGCGSFWRQASFWLRPGCFISHEVDSADFGEGDFDDPHGPEHWHFHHWRLGIPGPGPAELCHQVSQRHHSWGTSLSFGCIPQLFVDGILDCQDRGGVLHLEARGRPHADAEDSAHYAAWWLHVEFERGGPRDLCGDSNSTWSHHAA